MKQACSKETYQHVKNEIHYNVLVEFLPALKTKANQAAVQSQATYAGGICQGMMAIAEVDKNLATQENFDRLLKVPHLAQKIGVSFSALSKKGYATEENLNRIFSQPEAMDDTVKDIIEHGIPSVQIKP